jgi:hypothetical protein
MGKASWKYVAQFKVGEIIVIYDNETESLINDEHDKTYGKKYHGICYILINEVKRNTIKGIKLRAYLETEKTNCYGIPEGLNDKYFYYSESKYKQLYPNSDRNHNFYYPIIDLFSDNENISIDRSMMSNTFNITFN